MKAKRKNKNKRMKIVIASEYEKKLIDDSLKGEVIVTGVGALNVIKSLQNVDRNEKIYNIGYAGSNMLSKGSKVTIGRVKAYHPNITFDEPKYALNGEITCYTAGDFVTSTDIKEPCVFDMELAVILAMGFTDVVSEKVVSDNLSSKEFYDGLNE